MELVTQVYQKLINGYWPAYYQWLTEKLSNTEPFAILIFSVMVLFILVIYIWFRNQDGNIQ